MTTSFTFDNSPTVPRKDLASVLTGQVYDFGLFSCHFKRTYLANANTPLSVFFYIKAQNDIDNVVNDKRQLLLEQVSGQFEITFDVKWLQIVSNMVVFSVPPETNEAEAVEWVRKRLILERLVAE